MKKKVLIDILLIIAATSSTIYLSYLSAYNVLSLDDYGFVADLGTKSIWKYVADLYMNWQGRFSAFCGVVYLQNLRFILIFIQFSLSLI